jgi:hypothetical protein
MVKWQRMGKNRNASQLVMLVIGMPVRETAT